jgi:Peptidase inhibitor I78 family
MTMKAVLTIPVAILAAGLMSCIPKADGEQVSGGTGEPVSSGTCSSTGLDKYVGKTLTPQLEKQMQKEAGAALVRTAPQDGVVTMDYNAARLNIFHDDKNVIVRVNCG